MLKLISLNIERDKHLETTLPFFQKEKPDVICLQEVFEDMLPIYEKALIMKSFFKPMCYYRISNSGKDEWKVLGVAILTNFKTVGSYQYIIGDDKNIPKFMRAEKAKTERNNTNILLMWADISDSTGKVYRIASTHFTWTPDGQTTAYQKEDASKITAILDEQLKEFVLVGDLNAPRGGETFGIFAAKYKDNIPQEYDSSIDPKLHRAPGLVFMVDGLFSTPKYLAKDVRLIEGISDHKAVVAYIDRE
ncbi:MAG: endonuclease/exonuclease/phosphatase family protein [Candidatus Paceibacterota bacterium]